MDDIKRDDSMTNLAKSTSEDTKYYIAPKVALNPCPKCGRELRKESRWLRCICGWSKCD